MCLVITALAAGITTLIWYFTGMQKKYKLGGLSLMYWGASLMWLVDGFFALGEHEPFLDLSGNDALLGFVVVAAGFLLWVIVMLLSDPKHMFSKGKVVETDKIQEK